MSDTHDRDQSTFVGAPGARPGAEDGAAGAGRASFDSVDFDVTAGFGDAPSAAEGEFFDITQGAGAAAADDVFDLTTEAAAPPPAATPSPAPPPTPAALPETAGGGGRLALIGAVVAALVAAALWFALR